MIRGRAGERRVFDGGSGGCGGWAAECGAVGSSEGGREGEIQ